MMSYFWGSEPEAKAKPQVPPSVEAILPLLSEAQIELVAALCSPEIGQKHLFEKWENSSSPSPKRKLIQQLEELDKAYPDGLVAYIKKAKGLLEASKNKVNPHEGWKPEVPTGEIFDIDTEGYAEMEDSAKKQLGHMGFVLVAGGLGERLGYKGIKVGLPTESVTETSYLKLYIEYILTAQNLYAPVNETPTAEGKISLLPLCIMTSEETHKKTIHYLEANDYFGMRKEQVTVVQQGLGVPALMDNEARLALDPKNPFKIVTKPHGHGDIHALLHSNGVIEKWSTEGIEWVTFFQDTNAMAFQTLALALGVSMKNDLIMNSIAVPRKAKQAIGAITKLVNKETGATRTVNVEYCHLDPLLRENGFADGDVDDETTKFSPFPGNINQLIFKLAPYHEALKRSQGIMPEFVNPKYADESRNIFKSPTRVECMMQDFPLVLEGEETEKVGFTSIPADLCFSPVKNSTAAGAALQAKGAPPGCAASGEADQYAMFRKILRSIGVQIEDRQPETYLGVTVTPGPQIIIKPDAAWCLDDFKLMFPFPEQVIIKPNASLVIQGPGSLTIESMTLDGALEITNKRGSDGLIRDLHVQNKGWHNVVEEKSKDPIVAMRGYKLNKVETPDIVFRENKSYCSIM